MYFNSCELCFVCFSRYVYSSGSDRVNLSLSNKEDFSDFVCLLISSVAYLENRHRFSCDTQITACYFTVLQPGEGVGHFTNKMGSVQSKALQLMNVVKRAGERGCCLEVLPEHDDRLSTAKRDHIGAFEKCFDLERVAEHDPDGVTSGTPSHLHLHAYLLLIDREGGHFNL